MFKFFLFIILCFLLFSSLLMAQIDTDVDPSWNEPVDASIKDKIILPPALSEAKVYINDEEVNIEENGDIIKVEKTFSPATEVPKDPEDLEPFIGQGNTTSETVIPVPEADNTIPILWFAMAVTLIFLVISTVYLLHTRKKQTDHGSLIVVDMMESKS